MLPFKDSNLQILAISKVQTKKGRKVGGVKGGPALSSSPTSKIHHYQCKW